MESARLLQLLQQCEQRGGLVSHRRLADGLEVPYEINISWWSAMAAPGRDPSHHQRARFLLTQLLLLTLPGVPAFYLPALLATPNDNARFRLSGHRRDLNRPQFQLDRLERLLADVRKRYQSGGGDTATSDGCSSWPGGVRSLCPNDGPERRPL